MCTEVLYSGHGASWANTIQWGPMDLTRTIVSVTQYVLSKKYV